MHPRFLRFIWLFLAFFPIFSFASAYNASPKLVVVLIVDQFRGDYLDRYADRFGPGGFRLFLDRGAVFTNCHYDYANVRTGPGHATLFTGAYSNGHGIAANLWWSPEAKSMVGSVEDRRAKMILPAGPAGTGASPRNLLAATLGDELKLATGGKSRVFATSFKDSAAILSAGLTPDGAYWIDRRSGVFVTSSYYASELPAWVKAFASRAEKYWDREWKDASGKVLRTTARRKLPDGSVDPRSSFYGIVGATPFGTDYQLEFARELIAQEKLGRSDATDLLVISLSGMDVLGHEFGPDHAQIDAMVLALDGQLAEFFRYLDQQFGMSNVWLALSSDHGVGPLPRYAAEKFRLPAANLDGDALREAGNKQLAARFPKLRGNAILGGEWPFYFISPEAFAAANISQAEAELAVGKVMAQLGGWRNFFTRTQLAAGEVPADDWGRIYARSYTPYGGWYVLGVPPPFVVGFNRIADHSAPYSYDRHVPLAFYGAPFRPGVYRTSSAPVDMSVTLASLLGINAPTHAVGRVLTEALRDQQFAQQPGASTPAGARPSR